MARALEILIVEDDVSMQRMIEAVFKAATIGDYLVRRTGSLTEAVKCALEISPDLILLDLELPDATGLDGVRALLTLAPTAALVVLTSNTDEALAVEGVTLGAEDWLTKGRDLQLRLPRAVTFAVARQRRRRLDG